MIDPSSASLAADQEEAQLAADRRRKAAVGALRSFVFQHNVQAVVLAVFSLATALVLWGVIYLFTYWFALTFATLSRSFNTATLLEINDPGLVGVEFPWWFLAGAAGALLVALLVRSRFRPERLREGGHFLSWTIVELLMAVPNVTFSVWGNFSAVVRMSRCEAEEAWRLLERLHDAGGQLSAASLRIEVTDERVLQRIEFVLQIVGLVDFRERSDGWFLCLQDQAAFALLRSAGEPH